MRNYLAARAALGLLFGLAAAGNLTAQNINWNAGTGAWGVEENWSPNGVPNGNTYTFITNGGTAELIGTTGSSYQLLIGEGDDTSGRLDISASNFVGSTTVFLGVGGQGLINLTNGSVADFGLTVIGRSGGTGIFEINDSTLNAGYLIVAGSSGTGRLHVVEGTVNSSRADIGHFQANGIATFEEGSHWTIGALGRLEVGATNQSTGVVNILSGSTLETLGATSLIGAYQGTSGSGTATISGMDSKWISAGYMDIRHTGTLNVADTATAQFTTLYMAGGMLNITDGAVVTVDHPTETTFTYFGMENGSSNANITTGARLITSENLRIGYSGGTGTMTISDDATVENVNGEVGFIGGTGIANVNSGGTWKNSGNMIVGGNTSVGTLNVTGGTVENIHGYVGNVASGNGAANIGADGEWKNSGQLYVGNAGLGRLDITDGGVVENTDGHLGWLSSGNGTANVRSGGVWKNSGHLTVGSYGVGKLNIEGGRVESTRVYVGGGPGSGEVNLIGANSLLKITGTGELAVGYADSAEGVVNINGGTIESAVGLIGLVAGAVGTVNVNAGGTWENSANVQIGGDGTGILNIRKKGLVTAGDVNIRKGGTLELGGGSDPQPAAVEADLVQIHADGVLRGTGRITAPQVINEGTIELNADRTNWPALVAPRPSETSYQAGLFIQGDFTQSSTGKLSITLDSSIELQPRPAAHSTGLLVNGTATLDGELEVNYAPGYTPDIGDRFALISANQIVGKIAKFDDANIPEVTNRFLGLNYRSNSNGTEPLLELITLEAPRRLSAAPQPGDPAPRNLLLVTHGTNATADDWVADLGNAMASHANADWEVVAFDWKPYAGGSFDNFANVPGFDPLIAGSNAINIGESLVRWFRENGRTFDTAQLLAHSAGTWLVDAMTDDLRLNGGAQNLHLTLFEAFEPPVGVGRLDGTTPQMAEHAHFAEHYFHVHSEVLFTDALYATAVNGNLTALQDFDLTEPIESHGFPYVWYTGTAINPMNPVHRGMGAQLSQLYSGVFPEWASPNLPFLPNDLVVFTESDAANVTARFTPKNFGEQTNMLTGDVQVDFSSAILRTQSPAILTSLVELDQPFSAFEFDFEFLSANPGLLTVYLDTQEVFSFENTEYGVGPGDLLSSGWVWLVEEQAAGPHSITFRIDPLGTQQASIKVSNLQFISLEVNDPEPPGENGLIAYWNAENGAVDASGNGHDGVFRGNATTITEGPFGKAFSLDGSGDYIEIGDELDMENSDYTLSAWINGDPTMDQWARIFDKGYFTGYSLHRRAFSNEIGFEGLNSGNFFGTDSSLIDNEWHHVALVKEGTTITIYADGEAENSHTMSGAAQDNALPLLIGFNPGEGIQGFWKGLLDELRIYNRALSAAEIAALAVNLSALPGDFNGDNVVNAADYTVWRDGLGGGTYTAAHYGVWKSNFGAQNNSTDSSTVPEPATNLLAFVVIALIGTKK